MSKTDSCTSPLEVSPTELLRWYSRKNRRTVWQLRRKLQRRRVNVIIQSVRLGSKRQKLTLRRLVRWPVVQWRVMVDLMGPIKNALLEIAYAQRQQLLPTFPLVNDFPFPLV